MRSHPWQAAQMRSRTWKAGKVPSAAWRLKSKEPQVDALHRSTAGQSFENQLLLVLTPHEERFASFGRQVPVTLVQESLEPAGGSDCNAGRPIFQAKTTARVTQSAMKMKEKLFQTNGSATLIIGLQPRPKARHAL